MPSWVVLIVKIVVLLLTHFAMFKAGEVKEEERSRPLREAVERMRGCQCGADCKCECRKVVK
jgi:hypothetical protein